MTALEASWAALADDVERIFQALRDTAADFEKSVVSRRGAYTLGDIASLRPRIRATLESFRDLAVGTGIVTAPDVVADAPYWLEWWWLGGSGAPEALRVNLDPDGPDFFDYTNDEWFEVPIRTHGEHVAGPYVDYACTNHYSFTFSVPVHDGDRPLGTAAMDVPCDRVERRMMPALCANPEPLALLNSSGRVIAATRADLAPGAAVVTGWRQAQGSDALARLCALTGWQLVTPGQ